ncbi:NAD(P)H-dependent oxidoreductase [Paenibacillus alkaliterrae]|uniref:NAD(P)H-dependent oxidoreductase n=1 Tax=Paenibacillus alkaliterrae TaxID=320909 RepID=UPI001F374790|nr:NAD(P)H-dependent oxidoreductase [Paenibacillus alkaliterrae]MCF2938141.1 NAD(P)H-dependent oxidoreductase [Paenibacillus alkaliterrae]
MFNFLYYNVFDPEYTSASLLFDLFEQPLPFYSPDSIPPDHDSIQQLRQAARQADGIILASRNKLVNNRLTTVPC